VLIIGGGVMGAAAAYWLAQSHGLRVTVLERDPPYTRASSSLSASSIRQQFSTAINIALSQVSLQFYRQIGQTLAVDGIAPDIGLTEPGYLYLATDAGAATLREHVALQHICGVPTRLLDRAQLAQQFPWLAVDDLALGSLGISSASSGEGWFDGYTVLQAFRNKACALGVSFVHAEARSIETRGGRAIAVRTAQGTSPDISPV
jgi:glycine/D-amino acid oxidase-like deaminating enzyme